MKIKKYVMALILVAILLLSPILASAQYSDSITDSTGDVYYWRLDETGWGWRENVERPDIDIIGASIQESGGEIHVELEVKGTIQEGTLVWYYINLKDENDDSYDLYNGWHTSAADTVFIDFPGGGETLNASGFGTSTLQTSFSLDLVGNPNSLRITSVETHDWIDEAEAGEYYFDTAGPEAEDPVDDDDDTNGDIEFDEGIFEDIIARGMWCLALIIIIPVVIIILIVVFVFVLSKDDKGGEGGEQPPQQQYQQPPPPSGPSQTQQTQGQGGQRQSQTPPPPPDDVKKE